MNKKQVIDKMARERIANDSLEAAIGRRKFVLLLPRRIAFVLLATSLFAFLAFKFPGTLPLIF